MWLIYDVMMYLFVIGIRISTLWNHKSRLWIKSRKNWTSTIRQLPKKSDYRIWFHVSSLGEFEQARPVIEKIKQVRPSTEIILSFFSPSGYEIKRDYSFASVCYLPADIPGNAVKWLKVIQPDLAVFVKYDLWPGYLKALAEMKIPAMLISAHWIPGKKWSSWANPLTTNMLKNFKIIFLQQAEDFDLFTRMGFQNIQVAGDTRIDRCINLPKEVKSRIPLELIRYGMVDVVAGSTWPDDEGILIDAIKTLGYKAIIAPHDISKSNIDRLMNSLGNSAIKLSQLSPNTDQPSVIIVDNIGQLSVLYALGKTAYIGGGFGKGIHNSLEAMAHARPIVFGPHYHTFPEAVKMVELGGARAVNSKDELISAFKELAINGKAEQSGMICFNYIKEHSGATAIVTDYILKSIPYLA